MSTALLDRPATAVVPPSPESPGALGVSEGLVEQILVKALYFRGETLGRDLGNALGVKFSLIEDTVENLKRQHYLQVKRALGMGPITSVYALTDAGRQLAREYMEGNQYAGKVPVPLEQYAEMVRQQRQREGWLTGEMLREAYKHMVVSPQVLSQIGPAVSSGKSMLIYGQPGNGKTFLAEALFNIDPTPVFIPHAIEAQGMIIQLFDPIHHQSVDEEPEEFSVFRDSPRESYDQRWVRIRRPFIVSGGELDLKMLDLSFNPVAKFYDAPLQLKANNGIYLIDDFGRQKATPAEVLNRWIVPMERRIDFLTFMNGTKIHVPFECFLIFSSNLRPAQLGDEAFLRRIQYKMLLRSPDDTEFREIFLRFARSRQLEFEPGLVDEFIGLRYRTTGKPRRRCHPRDVLTHAIDLIRFEKRPYRLTEEVLDLAFESNFCDTTEDA